MAPKQPMEPTDCFLLQKEQIKQQLLLEPKPYNTDIRLFVSWCDEQGFDYTGEKLVEFTEYLMATGYAASTIHRRFYGCAAVLRRELEVRTFETDDLRHLALYDLERVIRKTKLPKRNTFAVKPTKYFERDEIKKLIKYSDKKTAILIEFLYTTGIRLAELINIQAAHIRKESRNIISIRIMGKRRKERIVFINSGFYSRIKHAFPGRNEYLFCRTTGNQFSQGNIREMLGKAGKDILGRTLSPHCLRHSFATHKIKETGKTTGVSHALGHSDISITLAEYNNELLSPEEYMYSGLYGKKGIRYAE